MSRTTLTVNGPKITRKREALGLSILEVAVAANLAPMTVRAAENSKPMRLDKLAALADALGVKPLSLLLQTEVAA